MIELIYYMSIRWVLTKQTNDDLEHVLQVQPKPMIVESNENTITIEDLEQSGQ